MSLISKGLDENKKYTRSVPPGGFTSNVFDYECNGKVNKPQIVRNDVRVHDLQQSNVYGYETESRPAVKQSSKMRTEEKGEQSYGSRFAEALRNPVLDLTHAEKMRTPRGLLRIEATGEKNEGSKNPPGGGSSDFWSSM